MKTKNVLFLTLMFCSLNGHAAFNEVENSQLANINSKSQSEVKEVMAALNKAQSEQVSDNPEKKKLIENLRDSWDITIRKRCDLETSESKGTDAEVSEVNTCLVKGYKEELEYFINMLP